MQHKARDHYLIVIYRMINRHIKDNALLFLTLTAPSLNAQTNDEALNSIVIGFERTLDIREIYLKKPLCEGHIINLREKVYTLEKDRLQKEGYAEFALYCALSNKNDLLIKNIGALISELRDCYAALQKLGEQAFEQVKQITKNELLTLISSTISDLTDLKKNIKKYVKELEEEERARKERQELYEKKQKDKRKKREKEEHRHSKRLLKEHDEYSATKKYTHKQDTDTDLLKPFHTPSLKKADKRLTLGLWSRDAFSASTI